jgi:hypothetical protein
MKSPVLVKVCQRASRKVSRLPGLLAVSAERRREIRDACEGRPHQAVMGKRRGAIVTSMAVLCGLRQIALVRIREYPRAIDPAMEGRAKLCAYVIQECLHALEPLFPLFTARVALQCLGSP